MERLNPQLMEFVSPGIDQRLAYYWDNEIADLVVFASGGTSTAASSERTTA
jgi:hypothetical protein